MQDSNHMEYNCIILHAQNATALQYSVFLTEITQLLVTSKGGCALFKRKPLLTSTTYSTFTICFSVKSGEIFTQRHKKVVQ